MSEITSVHETTSLVFSDAGIQTVMGRVGADGFRDTALEGIASHSMALSGLHDRMFSAALTEGDQVAAFRRSSGYIVAHEVLLEAASGGLMAVGELATRGYERRIENTPAALFRDFGIDFQGHPAARRFVYETLTNDDSKYGAMLMLSLHGMQANPGRNPIPLPPDTFRAISPQRPSAQARRAARASGTPYKR